MTDANVAAQYERAVLSALARAQGRGVSRDQMRRFVAQRLHGSNVSLVDEALLDQAVESNVRRARIVPTTSRTPPQSFANATHDASSSAASAAPATVARSETGRKRHKASAGRITEAVGIASVMGDRDYQEDRSAVHRAGDIFAAGVFDGHCGAAAAQRLSAPRAGLLSAMLDAGRRGTVPDAQKLLPPRASRSVARALFEHYDADLKQHVKSDADGDYPGSTAVVLVRNGDAVALYNVGDSRAALYDASGNVLLHTIDHTPDRPKEIRRVARSGGTIDYDAGGGGCFRVDGFLAMARSFGDFSLKTTDDGKTPRLTAVPDVFVAPLFPPQQRTVYALLASDGLWDTVGTKSAGAELLRLARETGGDMQRVADTMADNAVKRSRADAGEADNITVVAIRFDLQN